MDQDAEDRLRLARQTYDAARPTWHRAIYDALLGGAGVAEVSRISGYNREHVRRIRVAGDAGELPTGRPVVAPSPRPQVTAPLTLSVQTAPSVAPNRYSDVTEDQDGPRAEPFEEAP